MKRELILSLRWHHFSVQLCQQAKKWIKTSATSQMCLKGEIKYCITREWEKLKTAPAAGGACDDIKYSPLSLFLSLFFLAVHKLYFLLFCFHLKPKHFHARTWRNLESSYGPREEDIYPSQHQAATRSSSSREREEMPPE
jgi:hypothetical protein